MENFNTNYNNNIISSDNNKERDTIDSIIISDFDSGMSICQIAKTNKMSYNKVRNIIAKYRDITGEHVTADVKTSICEMHKNGNSMKSIAFKYGITVQAVRYIIVSNKRNEPNITSRETSGDEFSNPIDLSEDYVPIGAEAIIRCGLVADRHSMPVDVFIFDKVDNDLMFNYTQQEIIVNDFIDKYIKFDSNGMAKYAINCYLSGLQSVLATVIKVCHERRVNLTIRNYNASSGKYKPQIIWEDFCTSKVPQELSGILSNKRYAYAYQEDIEELVKKDLLYAVSVVVYDNHTIVNNQTVVCKTYGDMMAVNYDIGHKIVGTVPGIVIYLDRLKKEDGVFNKYSIQKINVS